MSLLSPPVYEANGVRAPDVATLFASGAASRRLDPAGVAALLWRGAAMGARSPVAGVVRVVPPGPVDDGRPPSRTTPAQFREALAAAVARIPEPRRLLDESGLGRRALVAAAKFDASVGEIGAHEDLARLLAGAAERREMPSCADLDADRLASGAMGFDPRFAYVSSIGARELFGEGAVFRAFVDGQRSSGHPPRGPSGDPMDAVAQRRHEVSVFGTIESQRVHALASLLPAATRAALSRVGPRPPDGVAPGTSGVALASDLLRLGRLRDLELASLEAAARRRGARVHAPFLDPAVVEAALGLDSRDRFGRPGSGGLLADLAQGAKPGPGDRSAPDPRAAVLTVADAILTPSRIDAQRLLVPAAVADAVARCRRGDAGWPPEAILLLARLTDWVEQHGLSLESP